MEEIKTEVVKPEPTPNKWSMGKYTTQLCIAVIVIVAMFVLELEAKEIVIAGVAGLTGFLNNHTDKGNS